MRVSSPTIRALIGLTLGFASASRAADLQPYKVDRFATGQSAMDATLRATSDLVTLRTTAPVEPYGLIARARGDLERLKTVLESYGYYESKVTIKIDGLALNDPRLSDELAALPKKRDARVQISFELGPLYHLGKITIEGELPASAQAKFALKEGDPAVAGNVLAAGARVLTALEDQGYAFAKADPPVAYEDKTEPLLDVTFHVETGPKLNIGQIHIEGLKRVRESLVRRRLLLHTGELYRASAIEHARTDLLSPQLGVFAAITVKVGTAVDETGGVPVTFQVRERLRHTFGVSAAYSTDLGGSGGINWGDRDVFGYAGQLSVGVNVTGLGGSSTNGVGYDVPIKYILPDIGHRDQSLQFAVEAVKQDLIAYDQTALKTGVTLTRKINKLWTVSVGMTATEEKINQIVGVITCKVTVIPCPSSDVESASIPQAYTYTLAALPLTVGYDTTLLASPLDDPTHGLRGSVTIAPTFSLGHSNAIFLITTVKGAVYFDLDRLFRTDPGRSVLAARGLIGAAQGASVDSLPPDQRFYGGGSASIRGYPYQAVGPYFPTRSVSATGPVTGYTTYPVGATTISAAGLEYRQRFGQSLGAAFFVDGGQVGDNLTLKPIDLFVGVGTGVRYYTPIGPIRLDFAVPLKRYDSDPNKFQVYIGLGQAF